MISNPPQAVCLGETLNVFVGSRKAALGLKISPLIPLLTPFSTLAITHDLSISLPVEAIVGIASTGKALFHATFFSTKSQILSVSASVKAAMALEASIVDPPPIPKTAVILFSLQIFAPLLTVVCLGFGSTSASS